MHHARHIFLILLTALLLQGCVSFNSLADAKNARGSGLAKEYSANRDTVWQQTLAIVSASDLKLVNADVSSGLILAQQPVSPLSLTVGQNVAIYVSEQFGRTRVEVIARKAIGSIEFTSRNWEKYIIGQLDEKLI